MILNNITVHLSSDLDSTFKNFKPVLHALVSYFPTDFSFRPLQTIAREERKRRNVCAYTFQVEISKNFVVLLLLPK